MKKYLFCLLLVGFSVISSVADGQSYMVDLTGLTFDVNAGVKNSTDSHLLIELVFQDNSTRQLYYRHLGSSGDNENGWSLSPSITVSELPVSIHVEGFVNFRTGTDASYDSYLPVNICQSNAYDVSSGTPRMSNITFNVKVSPILSLTSAGINGLPNSLLPDNDKVGLAATAGFPASVYNWEYSLDGYAWSSFPAATNSSGQSAMNISSVDLECATNLNLIGTNTFFRVRTCSNVYSNIVSLNNRLSSPHILSTAYTSNKCFGESNGNVKIQFDRALLPNELLDIYLEDTTATTGYNNDMPNVTSLDAGNSITWPSELPPGGYKITLLGKYPNGSVTTYTDGENHIGRFGFIGPTAISFNTASRDVYCNGGADATITISATGGVGNYQVGYKKLQDDSYTWINFINAGQHVLGGLDTGVYSIRVRDGNNCVMKDAGGKEVINAVTISQPADALRVDNSQIINPLAFGYTNGSIAAILAGGTPVGGNSYNVNWTKLDGTSLTPASPTTNPFTTQLKNLGDGKYVLFATDANYVMTSGANADGCMLKDTFTVTQPLPLNVTININQVISCKGVNDGKLYAQAEGGIQIPVFRYKYQWLKDNGGTWEDIAQSDSIASKLLAGVYKIIITDKNNITKESTPFTFTEPDQLELTLSSTPLICNGSNNGSASAAIIGGTVPYHIEWGTGDTTTTIAGLAQGNYMAFVTDAHSCQVQQQVKVVSPNPVTISNIIIKEPTCFGGSDGAITYNVTGGILPYSYQWNNNSTTSMLTSITAGNYILTIIDSNNCLAQQTFVVTDPARVVVDLGPDKTLCIEQSLNADATIPNGFTYQWAGTGGFTASTAKVTLNNAGTYSVKATDNNGCIALDTINITRSNAVIAAQMVAATQAFQDDNVELVNISKPSPEKVEWLLPADNITVISSNDQYAEVRFKDTGLYTIGMKTIVGACEKVVTQPITIVKAQPFNDPGSTTSPFIRDFVVLPNPSSGQFTVKITLQEAAPIELRLININSGLIANELKQSGSSQYTIPYNLTLASGIYSMVLETSKEYRVIKIMIL